MRARQTLAVLAMGIAFAGCQPAGPPIVTPDVAPFAPSSSSSAPTRKVRSPTIALEDTIAGPFATTVPPTVVASGSRLHLFGYGAGNPPALRYASMGADDAAPATSTVLPAKTIVAATACGRGVAAILRTGLDHSLVSIDEHGAVAATHPVALPDRPWAGFALACVSDRVWILGMTTEVDASVLWTVSVKNGEVGAVNETVWKERSSGLSAAVLGDDVVLLRSHGDFGGATLMRLRAGLVSQSAPLRDSVSGAARITPLGDRLAVAWTAFESGRQTVRLRLYDGAFEPIGPVRELASTLSPERLGALFMMPGPDSMVAVSYFTLQTTDEMIELPDGRSEPAERAAQYVVVFNADDGTASASLRMKMTGGLHGGGWAGDYVLFPVGRFSSLIARYRVQ